MRQRKSADYCPKYLFFKSRNLIIQVNSMKKIIGGIFIGFVITVASILAILYATGYRLQFDGVGTGNIKFIEGTGLLVTNSKPDGARVLINGRLTTATNNTINLASGDYDVQIEKDGYLPWKKKITIKNGLVSEANVLLFPTAPKLEAITTIGVNRVIIDATDGLIAYTVASSSAAKNGIYVLNTNSGPLTFLGTSGTQIASDTLDAFSSAEISFSPDGKEVLAKLPATTYLLTSGSSNNNPQEVTNNLAAVETEWNTVKAEIDKKLMDLLSRNLKPVAKASFSNMMPSATSDKLLYTASESATLPLVLKTKVPSLNSTPDQRKINKGNIYVYDIKEDKNFLIFDTANLKPGEKTPMFLWHPDSRHLVFTRDGKVNITEYDAGNLTTVFEGPFLNSLVFPWPDGTSIAIVARFSQDVPYNIYRIGLR